MAAGDNHHQVAATDALQENVNRYLPFLMELRKRILFLFSVFLVFGIAGFIYYEKIISFSLRLLDLKQAQVVFTSPFQFLNLAISSGLLCGIAAIFPLLILQILFQSQNIYFGIMVLSSQQYYYQYSQQHSG